MRSRINKITPENINDPKNMDVNHFTVESIGRSNSFYHRLGECQVEGGGHFQFLYLKKKVHSFLLTEKHLFSLFGFWHSVFKTISDNEIAP